MPEWLVPMAATLTQDRFGGGQEWLFERKFDGIRLLAYKRGASVQLFSRNRLPQHLPEVAAAVAKLPVDEVILDGEVTWDGRSGYHVFDILWLDGQSVTSAAAGGSTCAARQAAIRSADAPGELAARRGSVGACPPRGVGRRDRETERLAVRASPIEALAQDEVRGVAGAGGRRLHRSAGCARRPGSVAGRILRRLRLRLRRQDRHRIRHQAASRPAATPRRHRAARVAVHEGQRAAAASRALGAAGNCRAGRRSSSGPCTASCGTRVCSACDSTRTRAM